MNVEQLGTDLIKEQQKINLKFSSNETAVIPGDRAQVMLARLRTFCTLELKYNLSKISVAFECTQIVFPIQSSCFQAMQLFRYSGLLEMKAQELPWDASRLQTAALCGVATTNFLDLMENFYRVDKTPEEQALGDAASFSAFVAAHKKDEASKSLSKSKQEVETEEIDVGEDDDESDEEPKTLKQKKTPTAKYPSKCSLAKAHLFFPTSDKTVHETGVDGKLIGSRENLPNPR